MNIIMLIQIALLSRNQTFNGPSVTLEYPVNISLEQYPTKTLFAPANRGFFVTFVSNIPPMDLWLGHLVDEVRYCWFLALHKQEY